MGINRVVLRGIITFRYIYALDGWLFLAAHFSGAGWSRGNYLARLVPSGQLNTDDWRDADESPARMAP